MSGSFNPDDYLNVHKPKAPRLLTSQELFDKTIRFCFNRSKLPVELKKETTFAGSLSASVVNMSSNGCFSTLMAWLTPVDLRVLQKEAGYDTIKYLGRTDKVYHTDVNCREPSLGDVIKELGYAYDVPLEELDEKIDECVCGAFIYHSEGDDSSITSNIKLAYRKLFHIFVMRGVLFETYPDNQLRVPDRRALITELLDIDEEIAYRLSSGFNMIPGYFNEILPQPVYDRDGRYCAAWDRGWYLRALYEEGDRICRHFSLDRSVLSFHKP